MFGLLVKHTLADYYFQYSWMIKHKGSYGHWKGMAHSELHGLLTWIVLMLCGVPIIWAAILGILDTVVHYHIDYVKSNFWKSRNLGPADQMYWVTHGVDQLLHLLTYIAITWLSLIHI